MKTARKKLSIFATVACVMSYATMSYAAPLTSVTGLLNAFGYGDGVEPSVIDITPDELILSSANVYDEYKELAKKFAILYAPRLSEDNMNEIQNRILDLKRQTEESFEASNKNVPELMEEMAYSLSDHIENIKIKSISATDNESLDPVEMHLIADEDEIERSTSYYAIVIPRGFYENIGTPSQWFCFNLENEKAEQGEICKTFDTPIAENYGTTHSSPDSFSAEPTIQEIEHSSAKVADMTLANVSCKATENKAECSWVSVDGADEVDIFLWDWNNNKDIRIGSVKMKDEHFSYDLTFDGQQRLTFKPWGKTGGKEVVFNFNAFRTQEIKENTEKVDIKTPTGPKENAAIILALTALGYGLYRKFAKRYS